MKLIKKIDSLEHLKIYFLDHLELDSSIGFKFMGIHPNMILKKAINVLGKPTFLLEKLDNQQTAEYIIPFVDQNGKINKIT